MICCSDGKRVNDDNAPMYEVVLEIGHYRYRPLTAERLGRSISLITFVESVTVCLPCRMRPPGSSSCRK